MPSKPLLYFNTINQVKIREISEIFPSSDWELKFLKASIMEILSEDVEEVIRAKAAEAYKICRVPVIVEHGALSIDYFNGFPGALSKPMWDLMNDKICKLIPVGEPRTCKVLSGVCYCNGKIRIVVVGETKGEVSSEGRGSNGFQWDPIFIPDGETRTYAEMSQSEKLKFSQAAKAYNKLIVELKAKRII
jgi:XTP/dITP diphosphohydrolase